MNTPPSDSALLQSADISNPTAPVSVRMLYLYPDTMGPSTDATRNPFHYLSKYFTGDLLALWWAPGHEYVERAAAIQRVMGRFRFHWIISYRLPSGVRQLRELFFFVWKGFVLARRNERYDLIVSYGAFRTALAGIILKHLIGAKLVVEFMGHPTAAFDTDPSLLARIKRAVAPRWVEWVARRADHLRLLYPTQLDGFETGVTPQSVFHDFTTVRSLAQQPMPSSEPYLLFLGYPFHLKGVDILIRAFNQISSRFPEWTLRIVGHCPDRTVYETLAAGNPRINFQKAVPHDAAMELMARCSIFVLPSRTEAMGRVLLEAMATCKPVIASRVGGIPHYVRDGETGLLFRSEDVDDLADKMQKLMSNSALADTLAHNAQQYVTRHLSEEEYAAQFFRLASVTLAQ